MPDPTLRLPARPSLEQLRKQAKDLLKAFSAGDGEAAKRLRAILPHAVEPNAVTLADAQFVLAREYGFENWAQLAHHVDTVNPQGLRKLDALAEELAAAYMSGDYQALREINWKHGTSFVWERELTAMQQRLPTWFASEARTTDLALADARHLVARKSGFESWAELVQSLSKGSASRSAAVSTSRAMPSHRVDEERNTIHVDGPIADRHWESVIGVMEERGITGLEAGGITDAALERLSHLDLTRLLIGGSAQLTDKGMAHLARLTRLEELDLGGPRSVITDRGLDVLRHLTALRHFNIGWAPRVSDAGIAALAACDQLEKVNLMGTPTGDGAIRALTGKRHLQQFATGTLVTDAGMALFQHFPVFKTWQGGEIKYGLMSFDAQPTNLLADGPFTDKGLASLAGLEGLFGLNLFWHTTGFTSNGLSALTALPNLGFLGCDGKRCDDDAMRHIATIPSLRMLMTQGVIAGDDGFEALSRSQTVEYLWFRESPNLTGRGFVALSGMPNLRGLAASCKRVDDASLAALPRFPSLTRLLTMDVRDAGFRHVGACAQLEALWLMYCRDTTDVATQHIAALSKLKSYYAGMTRITDKSLEILGRMPSIERLEFWEIAAITDAGVAALSTLPRLREITIGGSPRVSRAALAMFPPTVRVNYEA
jgi:hypothetical protein